MANGAIGGKHLGPRVRGRIFDRNLLDYRLILRQNGGGRQHDGQDYEKDYGQSHKIDLTSGLLRSKWEANPNQAS